MLKHIRVLPFLTVLISFLFAACTGESNPVKTGTKPDTLPANYSRLSKVFDDLEKDTLYVYSAWTPEGGDFAFKGHRMDISLVRLMPLSVRINYDWQKDIGACYKFPLSRGKMGLILRTGGEYVASAIKLLVYDLAKDSVVSMISLANAEGDAGEANVYNSCLFKGRKDSLYILTYVHESYDHNEADSNPGTGVENWNYYFLYGFKDGQVDSLSADSATIVRRYPAMIKKLSLSIDGEN